MTFKASFWGILFLLMSPVGFAALYSAGTDAQLRSAIASINLGPSNPAAGTNTITITASFAVSGSDMTVLSNGATIDGGGFTISGAGSFRLFATSKSDLTIQNLTLNQGLAQGGSGSGGGMGAGGAVYIDLDRSLTLSNVTITNCVAQGGSGGAFGSGLGGGGASFSIANKNASGAAGGGDAGGASGATRTGGAIYVTNPRAGYGGGAGGTVGGSGGAAGTSNAGSDGQSQGAGGAGGAGGYCGGGGGQGTAFVSGGGGGGGGNKGGDGGLGAGGVVGGGGGGSFGSGGGSGPANGGGGGGGGFGGGGGDGVHEGGGGGGFGGGGGGSAGNGGGGAGGSYGGDGNEEGGGGAGIGGALFIGDTATLTMSGPISMSANNTLGGASGGGPFATPGSPLADDIFLFRRASILFNGSVNIDADFAIEGDPDATGTNTDLGITVSTTGGAIVTLGSPNNTFQGNITISNGATLNADGASLPGTNLVTTPGTITIQSGGTFGLTGGIYPTNTVMDNQLGGILNIAGTFAPPSTFNNAGTMNINTGGTVTIPGTFTNTGTTNINGSGNISGAYTGDANSILNIGAAVAATYTTSGTITGIEAINVVTSGTIFTVHDAVTGVSDQFTIAAGTTVNLNANFAGAATTPASSNSGTLNLGSTFALAGFTNNSGGNIFFTTGAVSSTPLTNNGTITVSNDSSSTADITNNSNFIVNANFDMNGQDLDSTTGTVTINGAGGVDSATYTNSFVHNMTIVDAVTFGEINSTGAVNLTGSTINVSSANTTPGTWSIITSGAGLLTRPEGNTNINLPSGSSALFGFWSADVTNSAVIITLVSNNFVNLAQGAFNIEVAGVLDQMVDNITNSGQQQLISLFRNSSNVQEFNTSLHEMMPIANSLQLDLEMQNTVYNKVEARIASADPNLGMPGIATGINVGDLTPSSFMWASASGSLTNQGHIDLNDGYNAKTGVFLLGADAVKCNQVVGVAAGYSISRIDELSNAGFATNTQRYHGLVYGTLSDKQKNYVDWLITGSFNTNDSHRTIAVSGVGLGTQADYNGYQFGARATTGKAYDFWESYRFTPLTYIQYSYLNQNDYNETGSIAALHVAEITQNIVTLGLGAKFAFPLDAWKLIGMRELRASISYDVLHPNNVTTANFLVGSNLFNVTSTPERISYKLGAGMTFEFAKCILGEINYDFEYRTGFTDHTLLGKVKYVF